MAQDYGLALATDMFLDERKIFCYAQMQIGVIIELKSQSFLLLPNHTSNNRVS